MMLVPGPNPDPLWWAVNIVGAGLIVLASCEACRIAWEEFIRPRLGK